jgi:uncharacterized protein (UPF0297 family)
MRIKTQEKIKEFLVENESILPKSQDETQELINEVRKIDRDQLIKELFDDFDSDSDSKPTGSDQRRAKAEIT